MNRRNPQTTDAAVCAALMRNWAAGNGMAGAVVFDAEVMNFPGLLAFQFSGDFGNDSAIV